MGFQVGGGSVANVRRQEAFSLDKKYQQYSANLPSMSSEDMIFTPAEGVLWEIFGLYAHIYAPLGAAAGTHYVDIGMTDGANTIQQTLFGASVFGSKIILEYNHFSLADSNQKPDTTTAQVQNIQAARADHDHPVTFRYVNLTDVAQVQIRTYWVGYNEVRL